MVSKYVGLIGIAALVLALLPGRVVQTVTVSGDYHSPETATVAAEHFPFGFSGYDQPDDEYEEE